MDLLNLYRERCGAAHFWAEPLNAFSNAAFLVAAAWGARQAILSRAMTTPTVLLLVLAAWIGIGSFIFHTCPTPLTLWMDVGPIAAFQVVFLWLAGRHVLRLPAAGAACLILAVVGGALSLMPVRQPGNGSLFYAPPLAALVLIATRSSGIAARGRLELRAAVVCFSLALVARTIDWQVPWTSGTHFVWHLLNGIVIGLTLQAWIRISAAPTATGPAEII